MRTRDFYATGHIITEAPPHHPYVQELTELGVDVHRLPAVRELK